MKTISLKNSAFVSVDNTKTFDDKSLNELYVPEGEQAAFISAKVADICKTYGVLTVNVFDKHPRGHISFASSYKNKNPFDFITLEEVQDWTDDNNGLSEQARFTIEQLKVYLENSPQQQNQVWPDHGKDWTESINLMPPLSESDFDIHLIKGDKVDEHPYGGFPGTGLDEELKKRNITTVFVGGVATDYCSGETASQAIDHNYDVYVITDAVRGVIKEKTEEMIKVLQAKGVKFIHSGEFDDLVQNSFDPQHSTD